MLYVLQKKVLGTQSVCNRETLIFLGVSVESRSCGAVGEIVGWRVVRSEVRNISRSQMLVWDMPIIK